MKKEEGNDNSFGVASVVLGIISLLLFFTIIPAIILAVISICFAVAQRKRQKNNWAMWGLILSILSLVLSIIAIIAIVSFVTSILETVRQCSVNPNLPGCEAFAQLAQQQQYPA